MSRFLYATLLVALAAAVLHVTGTPNASLAQEEWRGIRVAAENRCALYDRDDYPYSQSVELAIIAREGGNICSPYTNECFESRFDTDIEHIVAVSEAHDSGLCAVSNAIKRQFSSDLRNLTLASPGLNRNQKRRKGRGRLDARAESLLVFQPDHHRAPRLQPDDRPARSQCAGPAYSPPAM